MDDAHIASGEADDAAAQAFIAKWQGVTASELSTSQSFLIDLCLLLGVDTPHATAAQGPTVPSRARSLPSSQTQQWVQLRSATRRKTGLQRQVQ